PRQSRGPGVSRPGFEPGTLCLKDPGDPLQHFQHSQRAQFLGLFALWSSRNSRNPSAHSAYVLLLSYSPMYHVWHCPPPRPKRKTALPQETRPPCGAVDAYTSYAFGFLHTNKQPEAAVAVVHNDILPFYAEHRLQLENILPDNGREFCGTELHPF